MSQYQARIDPVLTAIERHRVASRDFVAASRLNDDVVADSEGRKITDEDQAELRRASAEEDDALNDLIHTSPETRAGAGAFLSYLVSISAELAPAQAACVFSALLRSPVLA